MKICSFLVLLFFVNLTLAQDSKISTLDLMRKYESSELLGNIYFGNRVNDQLVIYSYVDSVLSFQEVNEVELKIKIYGKLFKRAQARIKYDSSGKSEYKGRNGMISFPRRAIRFISNIPSNLARLTNKKKFNNTEDKIEVIKNSKGLITKIKENDWSETYKYNAKNELIQITREFSPVKVDSNTINFFCASYQNKWIGKYDSDGQLIFESSFWNNGNSSNSSREFENGLLTNCDYDDYNSKNNLTKKYYYENRRIREIHVFNSKQNRISKIKFSWDIN